MIAIVDYRAGNLTSVRLAFEALRAPAIVTRAPDAIAGAARVVFPGVGAAGAAMTNLQVLGLAEPLLVSTARGKYEQLQPSMDLPATLVAPVEEGQVMGTVRVMLDGEVVAERPLVALQAVERAGFFKRLWHEFLMWWQSE